MGRDLRKLLTDLIADDAKRRERAADLLDALDCEDFESNVALVMGRPDFPRRDFFRRAAARLVIAMPDRIDVGGKRPPAEAATSDPHRRAGRKRRAAQFRNRRGGAGFECSSMTLQNVLPHAADAALDEPAAVWAMLETHGCEDVAFEVLGGLGTRAAPLFLPELFRFYKRWQRRQLVHVWMLADVGRGDRRVIRAALSKLAVRDPERAARRGDFWYWAHALSRMGSAAGTPKVVATMHAFARSPVRLRRAAAAQVLPAVAPADPASADAILHLLNDPDRDEDDSVLPTAINGAAHLTAFADRLAPRLVELLPTFEEPNTDYTYGGRAARICNTLIALPGALAAAVPTLRAMLRRVAAERNLFLATSMVRVLEAAGDAARAALPELRLLRDVRRDRAMESATVRPQVVRLIRKLAPLRAGTKRRATRRRRA